MYNSTINDERAEEVFQNVFMVSVLLVSYTNIDQKLLNKLHGPTHY